MQRTPRGTWCVRAVSGYAWPPPGKQQSLFTPPFLREFSQGVTNFIDMTDEELHKCVFRRRTERARVSAR